MPGFFGELTKITLLTEILKIMKLLLLIPALFASGIAADNYRVANMITLQDLNKPCPGKYMEWYAMSNNESEWGAAQIKVFYLVDKGFLTRAASSGLSPAVWGESLGRNFRYFCEKSPIVTVREAAQQTINYMME